MTTRYQLEEERFRDQRPGENAPPVRIIGTFSTLAAAQAYPRAVISEEWGEATHDTDDYRWWSSGADDRNYYITEIEDDE